MDDVTTYNIWKLVVQVKILSMNTVISVQNLF